MKIRVTRNGIFGAKGAIPVGTELTLKAEPKHWTGKYEIVKPDASADAVPVTNDVDTAALIEAAKGDARKAEVKAARATLEEMGIDWQ